MTRLPRRHADERTDSDVDAITRPGAERTEGDEAREHTFEAVQSAVNVVRTTLGPRGKDKMIEQPDGTVLITNDASTILSETVVTDPTAALVVDVADAVGRQRSDGTTTAVVLAGALVREAEALIEQGVHPSSIIRGYERAQAVARTELDALTESVDLDRETRCRVAETTMTGKGLGADRSEIVDLVVSAAEHVVDGGVVDTDRVRIVTQTGRPTTDSEVVDGAVLTDDPVRESMPKNVADARVLLTHDPVQLTDTGRDTSIEIEDTDSFERFLEQEGDQIREMVEHVTDIGANAVLCSGSIADEAQSAMSVDGVLGVRQVDDEALAFAADVLGGSVVSNVSEATAAHLGTGSLLRDADDDLYVVRGDGETRATILLRGPTQQVVEELKRHAETALEVVASADDGRLVAGGGATEVELARRVRAAAGGVEGREQLAVEAFADALESIPRVLAENAGADPLDALLELRNAHAAGEQWAGIDDRGEIRDTFEANVLEPVAVKRQAVSSATEAANLVLRIDDILTVHELSGEV